MYFVIMCFMDRCIEGYMYRCIEGYMFDEDSCVEMKTSEVTSNQSGAIVTLSIITILLIIALAVVAFFELKKYMKIRLINQDMDDR